MKWNTWDPFLMGKKFNTAEGEGESLCGRQENTRSCVLWNLYLNSLSTLIQRIIYLIYLGLREDKFCSVLSWLGRSFY